MFGHFLKKDTNSSQFSKDSHTLDLDTSTMSWGETGEEEGEEVVAGG